MYANICLVIHIMYVDVKNVNIWFMVDKYVFVYVYLGIEDVQGRCDAIKEAVSQLNPIIVKVMSFLFSFLYK